MFQTVRRHRSSIEMSIHTARELALTAKARALKARQDHIQEFCTDKANEWNRALWHRLVCCFWNFGDWTADSARAYYDAGGLSLCEAIEWDCFVTQSYAEYIEVADNILTLISYSSNGMVRISSDDMEYLNPSDE